MRLSNWFQASLGVALGALIPLGTTAAAAPGPSGVAALTVSPVVGKEAVRVSGTATGARQLQAVLYARFSQDIPTVLLSRRPIETDANGRYDVVLPIAPAYFRGALVTVVVQTLTAVPVAQGSIRIDAPNVPAPPDELPPDYR